MPFNRGIRGCKFSCPEISDNSQQVTPQVDLLFGLISERIRNDFRSIQNLIEFFPQTQTFTGFLQGISINLSIFDVV